MKKLVSITILILFILPNMLLAAERTSLGFLYNSSDSTNLVRRTNGSINEVAPNYFDISKNGNLIISGVDKNFILAMKDDGISITPFLSNHWNRSIGRAAIKNRVNLISQIVDAINKYEFDGINIDIENLTSADRDDFTDFVRMLRDALPSEKKLTVSVAANPYGLDTGWQGSYDYDALGKIADYLFVMTYDEHSVGGACGPVASGDFVEYSIQYALQHVEKNKIVIGIPFYGRYWREESDVGGEAIVIGDVPRIISKFKAKEEYDNEQQTAKATFTVPEDSTIKVNGTILEPGNYTIWYENEQSIRYKLELVNKYNLKGAGVWALGQEKTNLWKYYKDALNEAFEEEIPVNIREAFEVFQSAPAEMMVTINMEKPDIIWNSKIEIDSDESKHITNKPNSKIEINKCNLKSNVNEKNTIMTNSVERKRIINRKHQDMK